MRHPHDKVESRFSNDTGISKEDEERYKKLVLENEELQKLITQVRLEFHFIEFFY
jgi:gamma-aminobutyric acid type B receptor